MEFSKNTSFLIFALSCFNPLSAEESPWEFTGVAGLSYGDGNADALAYSLQFLGTYRANGNEAILGVDHFYSEANGATATDSLKLHGQFNRDISERFYLGGFSSYFQDNVADIDLRIDTSLLLGYRVISEENMTLSLEFGPGYTWLDQGGMRDDFATFRFAQRFEYQFSELSEFWQSLAITPQLEGFSDYVLEAEMGVETRVTPQLALRTFVQHRINNAPALGKGKDNTAFLFGVSYDLNGLPEPAEGARKSLFPDIAGGIGADSWQATAALGFSMNSGNADSLGLVMGFDAAYLSMEREFLGRFAYNLRENNGATTEDQTLARVQYNHFVCERVYVGSALGYLSDGQADIDYRLTPGLLVGYYLLKDEEMKLAIEGGSVFTFEQVGGMKDEYVSAFVAERFSHQLSDQVTFTQSAEYYATLEDFSHYSLLVTAALDTKITDLLILRISADYIYESRPAAGRIHHDISLTSSIAVKF